MEHFNFTDRVRHGLQYAREEAGLLRHDYVGPEHMLLGLLRVGGRGLAALEALPVATAELRTNLLAGLTPGRSAITATELPYTSRAKKSLELAMVEARELGYTYVGTEHLLLGVLREETGIAARTLVAAGVTPAILRAEVVRARGASAGARPGGAATARSGAVTVTVVIERADGRMVAAKFADKASAISYLAGSADG
jgi:ATP-dependent Clp protease ATP-binding subunit ClpC